MKPVKNMLGKPWVIIPWKVRYSFAQWSYSDPLPQPLHHPVVHQLAPGHELLGSFRPALAVELQHQVAADLGPDVADQVGIAGPGQFEGGVMEIDLPLALPARRKALRPLRVG